MIQLAKKSLIVFAIGVLANLSIMASGFSQSNIAVDSKVDRSTIHIGDVIRYSVIITHEPGVQLKTPSLAVNLGMFEIRDYKVLEPKEENGRIISQTDYLISTFDTGEYEIPSLQIGYTVGSDTTRRFLKTEPIKIMVASLNPDQAGDIRDIKAPLVPEREYKRLILLIGGIILVLALIGFIFYYLKRRKEGKSLLPRRQKPPRPAHEVALEALEKLIASDLLSSGKIKEYYIRLSEIIRQYVEERYFIDALEMTTTQLIDKMHREQIHADYITMMREFLDACDLVKFAKYMPANEENSIITQLAFDFVNQTKLVVVEPVNETTAQEPVAQKAEPIAIAEPQNVEGEGR
jgi:hypothetical protein